MMQQTTIISANEQIVFDSRNIFFKSHSGAAEAGTEIRFTIALRKGMRLSRVVVSATFDRDGSTRDAVLELRPELGSAFSDGSAPDGGTDGGALKHAGTAAAAAADMNSGYSYDKILQKAGHYDHYTGSLIFEEAGLYWYRFFVTFEDGHTVRIGRNTADNRACFDTNADWQQTVYRQMYEAPEWIAGGVYYQIFVDRFRRGGDEARVEMEGKVNRYDWDGVPEYRPNEYGEILNNDFFGGNLRGIIEKLPYLTELGVTCLYLNPIFEAYSNHKYDTADYMHIDPMFGNEEDFRELCRKAEEAGIRIVLDGVFSHTGSDSVYFNKEGHYGSSGAWNDPGSPYRCWYNFRDNGTYESWWGFETLPCLNKNEPAVREFINGENGVVRHWLREGASGWRLDVADELPASFTAELAAAARTEKPDALIIGEVWEDASNKIAYGERKNYFDGSRLDSVMNYPLRSAIIGFVKYGKAFELKETVESIGENYPKYVTDLLMNNLGTHDRERILTALGADESLLDADRSAQAQAHLGPWEKLKAVQMLKMASFLQMTLPGVPCIYYGDEAGVEGYKDPFNRTCFPWGHENKDLQAWYKKITGLRRENKVFAHGTYKTIKFGDSFFAYAREEGSECIIIAANVSEKENELLLPGAWQDLLTGETFSGEAVIPSCGMRMLKKIT